MDENGPKVIAAVLDAEPAGDAAALNNAVTREYPVSVPISEPDTEVGVPAARPAHKFDGRVGVAPCKHQSSIAFDKSVFVLLRGLFIPRVPPVARRIGLYHHLERCRALVGRLLLGLTA